MSNPNLPNLTITGLPYGTHETHLDLSPLLYINGAEVRSDLVSELIESGALGLPIYERLPLIIVFFDGLVSDVKRGLRRATVINRVKYLRSFYTWCDERTLTPTLETVASIYYTWADHLKSKVQSKGTRERTVYRHVQMMSFLISRALYIKNGLIRNTRFGRVRNKNKGFGPNTDKQNLELTFEFGSLLEQILSALTVDTIYGKLPVNIETTKGTVREWCGLIPPERIKSLQPGADPHNRKLVETTRLAHENDRSPRTRFPLINMRIEAELLVFISQTSINLAQAFKIPYGKFRFQTIGNETLAYRTFKNRRQGEAIFKIHKDYKKYLERYFKWLDAIFPDGAELLFPFIYPYAIPSTDKLRPFQAIEKKCLQFGIKFIPPSKLRNTRSNWFLRKSRDLEITAEISQHTKETLVASYEDPNFQVAALEISRFFAATDPSISPPGPGTCISLNHAPIAISHITDSAPSPDCITPAGCLFCEYHRDIDSLDYIWSLATFRYLKRLELDKFRPSATETLANPAATTIERVSLKIHHISAIDEAHKDWAQEATDRIREGRYHPIFDGTIQLLEASQ